MADASEQSRTHEAPRFPAQRLIERVTKFTDDDLHALAEATSQQSWTAADLAGSIRLA